MSHRDTDEKFKTERKCEATILDDIGPLSITKPPPPSGQERASFISIISKSRLFSEGPSEQSRALVFALTVLIVTITCLVFLLGVRVIRGGSHEGMQDQDIGRMLGEFWGIDGRPKAGQPNTSYVDSDGVNNSMYAP
ncbi:uncharacterized protein LOC144625671 [Crassostrea virginica]